MLPNTITRHTIALQALRKIADGHLTAPQAKELAVSVMGVVDCVRQRVLVALASGEAYTVPQLAEEAGVSIPTARKYLHIFEVGGLAHAAETVRVKGSPRSVQLWKGGQAHAPRPAAPPSHPPPPVPCTPYRTRFAGGVNPWAACAGTVKQ